jgi:hypothetical protein
LAARLIKKYYKIEVFLVSLWPLSKNLAVADVSLSRPKIGLQLILSPIIGL